MSEVVVTGIGVVGPHGVGMEAIAESAGSGRCVFTGWPASADPPSSHARMGAVGEYPRTRYFSERHLRQMDKAMSMSAFAAGIALEDAGFADGQAPGDTATLLGTARAEQTSLHKFMQPLVQGRPERINPADFPLVARNISCGQIAIRFGLRGPSSVLSAGGTSSLSAIMRAAHLIRTGRARVALAGGLETLSRFALYMARQLYGDCLGAAGSAYFGRAPAAPVPSEGACLLVLESAEHARERGARAYARLASWQAGRFGDGDPAAALAASWQAALTGARATPAQVDVVVAGAGGGNRAHEQAEARALLDWPGTSEAPRITAPRSIAGEGEAWTSALQVACAARTLAGDPVWPVRELADDCDARLRERCGGGSHARRGALVSGIQPGGAHCALFLQPA